MVFHPYLYHIGEPQRDEEIDGKERDGEGGETETMYVCMYVWVHGCGGGIGVDLLCDGISDAYIICSAGVLASRPDMWRAADTAGGCRWSAGISNLLAIHSAEEVIASTATCKVPHCLEMKEQVRSATIPASLHIHLRISSDVYEPYKVLHTYIQRVHIVHSLLLTIFGIRRELAVRQQQMDDTVGGEGTWIGNITAPGQRRARGFYPAPWCWAGLPTEGRWLHHVYICSLPIRIFPSLKFNECMWYDDMLI